MLEATRSDRKSVCPHRVISSNRSRFIEKCITDSKPEVNYTVVELPLAFVSGLYSSLNVTLPEDEIRSKQPLYHHTFSELGPIIAVGSGPDFWANASNDSSVLTTGMCRYRANYAFLLMTLLQPYSFGMRITFKEDALPDISLTMVFHTICYLGST